MTHGLDTKYRTSALLTELHAVPRARRAGPYATPLSAVAGPTPVAALHDGAERVGALARMDAQNRIHASRPAAAAGWPDRCDVVVVLEGAVVRVWPGRRAHPWEIGETFALGRLTLPAGARNQLHLLPGDQVLVSSVPNSDQLVLASAGLVLQDLTGPIAVAPRAPVEREPQVKRHSAVKAAFRSAS